MTAVQLWQCMICGWRGTEPDEDEDRHWSGMYPEPRCPACQSDMVEEVPEDEQEGT
jgi:hypothetical protein